MELKREVILFILLLLNPMSDEDTEDGCNESSKLITSKVKTMIFQLFYFIRLPVCLHARSIVKVS